VKVLVGRVVFALVVAVMLLAGLGGGAWRGRGAGVSGGQPELHGRVRADFTTPPWGDAGAWTDPSQYSTIRLGAAEFRFDLDR
jgi:hypothetical protein